jgi:hypothetical protein
MERESLKRITLNWFQAHAAAVLGPSEINVHTDENVGKTTFTVMLKRSPPVVERDLRTNSSEYEVHENIRLYLDVIEEGFLEVLVYLELEVSSKHFPDACELANYLNARSSSGHVQVFDEEGGLIIRVKVASSTFTSPSDRDFHYLFASCLNTAYQAFELFYPLSSTDLDSEDLIDVFGSNVPIDSHHDSDHDGNSPPVDVEGDTLQGDVEIRSKVADFSKEFKNIVSGLEASDYWEEKLDYSIESFEFLDQLVDDLWPEEPPNQKNIEPVVAVFGSYIAQTLMHAFDGFWAVNSDGAWKYIMALGEDQPDIEVYPFVWMRKRFDKGDLISEKYESLMAYSEQIEEPNLDNSPRGAVRRQIHIDQMSGLLDLSAKGPSTDANARPTVVCHVINHRVVLIKDGSIRGACVKNLFFLPSDEGMHPRHDGRQRVSVKCYWYNWRPKTSWMGILVKEGAYEIIENYSGEVVVNFGRGD